MMIEKYPAAVTCQDKDDTLPLHIECYTQCRSIIIRKCIEIYPEALRVMDDEGNFPLHIALARGISID
jgi:ankyrin repeat protein